jgi:single-strand DNA-binding protein
MQKLFVTGNLTKDAEKRYTQDGKAVLSLNIAVNDWNGTEKTTLWIHGSIWGVRAESLEQYLTKGTKVSAFGTLLHKEGNPKTYTTSMGETRANFEMLISEIDFSGEKKNEQEEETPFL